MKRPSSLRRGVGRAVLLAALFHAGTGVYGEPLPPKPAHYFNDYAGFVPADAARALDSRLVDLDRGTSIQIVVAIFPSLPPSTSLEDFTVRTAQSWRVGDKKLDRGLVLFVFVKDHKLRVEVGYGLEDKVPDAVAVRIVNDVIAPKLRAGEPVAGLGAGVDALIAAVQGRPLQAAPTDDVPVPAAEGLNDQASLLGRDDAERLRAKLKALGGEGSCRLSISIFQYPPSHYSTGYAEAQLFTVRSFFRSRPASEAPLGDDARVAALQADPSALLFVFVRGRDPLDAAYGLYGLGCLPEEAALRIVYNELEQKFPKDPAGSLGAAIDAVAAAHRGEYAGPPVPVPTPFTPASQQAGPPNPWVEVVERIVRFNLLGLPLGIIFLVALASAILALPLRCLPIRRRMRAGQGFFLAWGLEALWILSHVGSGSGSTYSSGGSSGSSGGFSGGGGSFGGGGASGSW